MAEMGSQAFLAFAAGLLSVLSPCVLPLMPAYLSLISGITVEELQEHEDDGTLRARVMRACGGFVLGFSLVFVLLGVGAVSFGRVVRGFHVDVFGVEVGFTQVMGCIVILLGLHLAGLTPIRVLYRDTRPQFNLNHYGFPAACLVGAAFALGWSPCIGPILASILSLAAVKESALEGAALLTLYSAGLAVPFLLAGWSIEAFFAGFARIKQHFRKLEIGSGIILVGVGMLLLTDRLSWLNSRFSFMNEWVNAVEKTLQ
ncbi:MAG: cytochrome c biogenesis protein CcdA [Deltaproteobacteria bacterium]|nr:cytochrome c biogenesis protein CcdA [Deltaproteobacteria bacterium]MBW2360297.1 cytochrome c biogenesis protein CcdA [Deltaproteobacteria bacterium]